MPPQAIELFYIGDWQVSASTNSLRNGDTVKQLEPKAMNVLIALCQQQGEVLSADQIVDHCWGDVDVGDNPVHKAINQLRKAFDDKPNTPTYIETIRKRGYRIIAELTFPLNQELKAAQANWLGASPFPGLSAFEPNEATIFFGRNEQISTLLSRISKQVIAKRAFCLILGPSGTGKSSLVNAGVLPNLLDHNGYDGIGVVSYSHLDFADINQGRLLLDLASSMLDWDIDDQAVFAGMSADNLVQQLQGDCQALITQCQNALNKAITPFSKPHFFLFIDRLEVLLSSPLFSDAERSHFLGLIETLATSGCIMVFSACRNDFYPLVVTYPNLMAGKDNGAHFDLLAPTRSELMQMIRLPAIAANLTWSSNSQTAMSLDELLCNEASNNPDSLPMLQYTLQELYLQRNESNELQESVYLSLGGIEGAIGKKAEEIFQQLPESQQAELDYVLSLLVTLNPDGETITSRAARWSQLKQDSQSAFVQALVDSRLLVSHLQNNEACFSLAHEALLRRWPRASQWISDHKDSLAIKSRLQILTQRWLNEGKSTAYLLADGKPLQEALSLQKRPLFKLEPEEQALIRSSLKRVKIKRWSTGITILLLCVLSFTSVLMSIKSQESQNVAQQKRLEAESLLGFMVGEFADKLRSVQRMDLLDGISNKALEYFSQQDKAPSLLSFANQGQNYKARFQHAQTLGAMGEVAYSRAKNDEAQQAFITAKTILDKLYVQRPDNLELLKTLGANAFWLGQLAYDQSDFISAQPLFELYRDYSEQMNQLEPDNVDGWVELSDAQSTLGSLYLKQQEYTKAKVAFGNSLTLLDRIIVKRPKDDDLQANKADTLSWLAKIDIHFGNLSDSLQMRQQGQEILERLLSTSPDNARIMEILVQSHMQIASIFELKQQNEEAIFNLTMAKQLINNITEQDKDNEYWRNNWLLIYLMEETLKSKINLKEDNSLVDVDGLTNMLSGYGNLSLELFFRIVRYLHINQQWNESEKYIRLAKRDYFSATNELIVDQYHILLLAEVQLLEVKLLIHQNKNEGINQRCQKVIQQLRPLINKSQSPYFLLPYVQAFSCIDQLNKANNELQILQRMGITEFDLLTPPKKENKNE
jgi:DNA-binding winged helix-turn-helix (wHTH) protein/energy-coupling factor transporter ATP-binding protein EcfA2